MASRSASAPPATYADLEALPEGVLGQIVDGELVALPRPAIPHALATTAMSEELGGPFRHGRGGPGGWVFLFEPELRFGGDVLVPDLAGWRRERLPELGEAKYLTLAPDWVCEVVSPSSASVDRVRKPRIYAREGVPWYWIVDPVGRSLEVLQLDGASYRLITGFEGEERVRAAPFDAIEFELALLWKA